MRRGLWILWASVAFLCACMEEVAGGSSEHENVIRAKLPQTDSVLVVVQDSKGNPLPHVTVRAVDRINWASRTERGENVVMDSAFVSDGEGRFFVGSALCAHVGFFVDVRAGGLGYARCAERDSAVKLEVRKAPDFHGKTKAHARVGVYGSGLFTTSDAHGHWHLPLPGELQKEDVVWMDGGNWKPFGKTPERLLVEDFSDAGSLFTLLHRFNGGSRWWASFGSDSLGDSTANLPLHRIFADREHGLALHVELSDPLGGKAMVGFDWGLDREYPDASRVYRDLSRADTLFFSAKGSGQIRVQFVCRASDLLKNSAFETMVRLDSVWTDYALPVAEFAAAKGSTLVDTFAWEEVNRHCKATVFYADGSADLWLDNIAIGGVLLRDIE